MGTGTPVAACASLWLAEDRAPSGAFGMCFLVVLLFFWFVPLACHMLGLMSVHLFTHLYILLCVISDDRAANRSPGISRAKNKGPLLAAPMEQ